MSCETQGRQYHTWFGHGTSGESPDAGDRLPSVAGDVADAALAAMDGSERSTFAKVLRDGGAADLAEGLPIWVASSRLPAERFRALLVGRGFDGAGAASLQGMGRVLREGVDEASIRAAGRHLAAALARVPGEDWRYGLNTARDMAVDAVAGGRAPGGAELERSAGGDVAAGAAKAEGGDGPGLFEPVQYTMPLGPFPLPVPLSPAVIPGTR